MLHKLIIGLVLVLAVGCGKKGDDKDSQGPQSQDQEALLLALPGTYQQVAPGIARLIIDSDLVISGTTLEIPGPEGLQNRYTPQFPQVLTYDAAKGYFSTIGTYNDSSGVFKNVEIRLELRSDDRFLDVTLVTPPDEALSLRTTSVTTPVTTHDHKSGDLTPQHGPSSTDPTQQHPHTCDCPTPQLFYVYRFERQTI